MSLAALAAGATFVSASTAASNRALPSAGSYTFGGNQGGFKINRQRNRVTNLRLVFTLDPTTAICAPTTTLPVGRSLSVTASSSLKLHAAHVGRRTEYIVGRATPGTIGGVTAIPETFRLSTGHKANGTMFLTFSNLNGRGTGSGQLIVSGCTLVVGFRKR
jgi:hypothetical protein